MDRRFLVVIGLVILGLVGLFAFTKDKATAPSNTGSEAQISNHIRGNKDSAVNLMVYGDFQCSSCLPFFYIEQQIMQQYSDKISQTFRHFPIEQIHPNALASARAAEAAGMQDKFFEMHDTLYNQYDTWVNLSDPLAAFTEFAKELNLDIEKFKTDFASETVLATINADREQARKDKVDGTPTYFINNEKLDLKDIQTFELFAAKIDEAIKNSSNQ